METTHSVPDSEKEGEYKEETAVEILNSMVPLWRKNKNEISTEEYNEFYKSRFTDYHDPLDVIHFKSEGTATFDSIIYIPSAAPFDFYSKEYEKGLALYTNGVMIMENARIWCRIISALLRALLIPRILILTSAAKPCSRIIR